MRVRSALDDLLDPDFLKALAEPMRVRMLCCLIKCGRACSVTEIAECCEIDFSVVSRHLALLAQRGLLESEKRGRTVWYSVNADQLAERFRSLAAAVSELSSCQPGQGCCEPGSCSASKRRSRGAES